MVYYVLATLGLIEYFAFLAKTRTYPYKEALSSLVTSTLNTRIFQVTAQVLMYNFYMKVYLARLFDIRLEGFIKYLITFLVVDFGYYWIHRFCHTVRFSWTAHEVHHYPNTLTILNATSQSFVGMFFNVHIPVFALIAYLGFEPKIILQCYGLNLLYQLWLHNELIPRIPIMEKIFNTPHLHRIHHSMSKLHLGKNYGGVLIIFDRFFKTYHNEVKFEDHVYGVIPKFEATSIISTWVREFDSWKRLVKEIRNKKSLWMKLKAIFVIED